MKVKFITTETAPLGYTTVGYWRWTEPDNQGTLEIYVAKMKSKRHYIAVLGHECIEALYCWLLRITTEQADSFDKRYERGYEDGTIPLEKEPGHDPKCPYHWGHMMGVAWEHFWITVSLANFGEYEAECNQIMEIFNASTSKTKRPEPQV